MKLNTIFVGLLSVYLANGCIQDDGDFCTAPHGISIDQTCYGGNGIVLRAGDYGRTSGNLEWEVYTLKDTTRTNGFTAKDLKIKLTASNQLPVPDSVAKSYQRLVVTVANNCQGTLKRSAYYAFIKTTSSGCVKWSNQLL